MKTIITILTAVVLSQALSAQTTIIPDANFEQALIDLGYDTGTPDGSVPTANISSVTYLQVANKNISDLTGIEDFAALDTLQCQLNLLSSLNMTQNTALTYFTCFNNFLTNIDVSNNTALATLSCGNNQLTSLDVSNNTALATLDCANNLLTSLDVSNNTALYYGLDCANNLLTSLDVSNNTALWFVECDNNQLTSLNVNGATDLRWVYCNNNQLTSLDVSGAPALNQLYCYNNQLTSLDLSQNIYLSELICQSNQLTCLNIKNTMILDPTYVHLTSGVNNPMLACIEVDDVTQVPTPWPGYLSGWGFDSTASFSTDCNNACSSCNITVLTSAVPATCPTCADGTATATATGGTGPYTYSWNTTPVQTSSTATGLIPGWHSVMVSDSIGCNAYDAVKVCDSSSSLSFTYVMYGQDSVIFTNTSTGNGFYALYFGDGNYQWNWAQSSSITHVYAAPGTYYICLNDTLNNLYCSGQSNYCDSIVIVDTTSGSPCNASFYPYLDTTQTNMTYLIENSTGNNLAYFWDFDDGNTSTQQYPTHYYTNYGVYNICLTVSDTVDSCQDIFCIVLTIDSVQKAFFEYTVIVVPQEPITGMNERYENDIKKGVLIYPNPTAGILHIKGLEGRKTLLYDSFGRLVLRLRSNNIDMQDLPKGVYFIRIFDEDGGVYSQKVLKE